MQIGWGGRASEGRAGGLEIRGGWICAVAMGASRVGMMREKKSRIMIGWLDSI